jgi:hypothetical protein
MLFNRRMETYTELCSRMLRQFKNLLRHDPCVFGKQQLVQMMAINMYQIEVAKQVNISGRNEFELLSAILCKSSFQLILLFVHNMKNHLYN